jgi:predicted secreted protein
VLDLRWKLAISSVCLLLLVAGCGSESLKNFFTGAADVTANDSDNGRHIQLNKGQIFDIVLADDYETSKCQWRDDETYDTTILEPLGQRYEPGRAPPGDTGGGTNTQRYKAARSGTVHVTLVQQDNANPPHVARRFALDVTVR